MKHKYTKTKLTLVIASVLSSYTAPVFAEEQAEEMMEEIVVKGYRSSLLKANDIKRDAVGSQDSILAEDIADFPDLNLAESLQRVPGVTITREAGEGRQIALRGLNASFTQVQVNGMEALGTSSSAMDNRGSVNGSRSFDFNIFASELFNRIDVKKSFSADMDEGGIGGTVGLRTAKPFDYDGFKGGVNVQVGENSQADGTSPRFAGLLSNTWGDFGALVSLAYSNRKTNEQGFNTYRWRLRNSQGSDISALSAEDLAAVDSGELYFSRGSRYSVYESDQDRLGLTLAFQYKPSDDLSLGLDILKGKLDSDRDEFHLQSRGSGSTNLGCTGPSYNAESICSKLVDIEYNLDNEVIYSSWEDAPIHSESRDQYANTDITQVVANIDWLITDRLSMKGLIGSMESDFETGSVKAYLESFADVELDYRADRFYANNNYINDYDPTNIDEFRLHEIDLQDREVTNGFDVAKLDFIYAIDDMSNFSTGFSLKQFEHENNRVDSSNLLRSDWQDGILSDVIDPDLVFINNAHEKQQWLSTDINGALAAYNIDRDLTFTDAPVIIEEETFAAYIKYDFDMLVSTGVLRGNVGLRYYDTTIESSGTVNDADYVTVEKSYDGILPSANIAWDISDNLVWRASASKNLTRPSLSSLSVEGDVVNDPNFGSRGLNISAGNPGLNPFESINYETGLEYYFDEVGFIAVTYYYKDIENFIVSDVSEVAYIDTGYPLSLLGEFDENGNPQTGDTIYSVFQPINIDETSFSGWEISVQRDLDFLPEPFNNLGVIANFTTADGEASYEDVHDGNGNFVTTTKPFPGLSDRTANFTVYYENDNWGARVSSAYRSDYVASVRSGSTEEDENGYHATTYWDFSAFYNVSENLKVTLEGVNLSNEREEQYSDTKDRLYNTTTSGRTFYVGASYSF